MHYGVHLRFQTHSAFRRLSFFNFSHARGAMRLPLERSIVDGDIELEPIQRERLGSTPEAKR